MVALNRIVAVALVALFSGVPSIVEAATGRAPAAMTEGRAGQRTTERNAAAETNGESQGTRSYADREKAAADLADFRGGEAGIYIGGSAAALLLLILVLIILF